MIKKVVKHVIKRSGLLIKNPNDNIYNAFHENQYDFTNNGE